MRVYPHTNPPKKTWARPPEKFWKELPTYHLSKFKLPTTSGLGGQWVSSIFVSALFSSDKLSMYAWYVVYEVSIVLLSTVGFHVFKPGRRMSSGWRDDTSINSYSTHKKEKKKNWWEWMFKVWMKDPPVSDCNAAAMTASFSTGFNEHVEYTIRPSSLSIFIARCRIRSWSLMNKIKYQKSTSHTQRNNRYALPMQSIPISSIPPFPNT